MKMKRQRSLINGIIVVFVVLALTVIVMTTFNGCGMVTDLLVLKGELVGNDYTVNEYDNFGNRTLTVHADKVRLDGELDSSGEPTSYIDITIDGYDWKHVGSTLIFMQAGVDMITDFSIPDEINSTGDTSTGLMDVDRFINSYKNYFGRSQVVLVSSQNGTPICLFRGDKCNVQIPSNLPKMTLINIDGKLVYVHRATVDIIPAGLFDN